MDGLVIGDAENEFLAALIRRLSSVYFAKVLGFYLMGTHFHLLAKIHPDTEFTDDEIKRRFKLYYGDDNKRELSQGQIPLFRLKWASLSEYVKEIKRGFSRFYNKLHKRKGFSGQNGLKALSLNPVGIFLNFPCYQCYYAIYGKFNRIFSIFKYRYNNDTHVKSPFYMDSGIANYSE